MTEERGPSTVTTDDAGAEPSDSAASNVPSNAPDEDTRSSVPSNAPDHDAPSQASERPAGATFRTPRSALVAVVFLTLCLSPIAFQGGPWFLLLLIPLAVAWWVLRTRTVVDGDGLRVDTAWGSTRRPWSQVSTLRLVDRGWVRAVDTDGRELPLRAVRIRDLGRLGEASGGRIAAPTPAEARAAAEHARELEAARMRVGKLRELRDGGAPRS